MSDSPRKPLRSLKILAGTVGALVLVAGVGFIGYNSWSDYVQSIPLKRSGRTGERPEVPPPSARDRLSISSPLTAADLQQTASGPGLVVCDPHIAPQSRAMSDFAMGCAAWLQFHAAGQPALGKTPRYLSIRRAQSELGKGLLDLRPEETVRFGRITGVTHVALGSIEGTPEQCRLRFQLYTTQDGKPFGPPEELTGTERSVSESLPEMARNLTATLGVTKPAIPAPITESSEELRQIGQFPWTIGRVLTPRELETLERMRSHSALALLYLLLSDYREPDIGVANSFVIEAANNLANRYQGNTLAVSEAAIALDERRLSPLLANADQSIRKLLSAHPNNYLLHSALAYSALRDERRQVVSRDESALAVRAMTSNPDAWYALANATDHEVLTFRKGRVISDLTPAEISADAKIKERSAEFWKRVVEVDPGHLNGWVALASSAASRGDAITAERALQKACSLPYSRLDGYQRALELYGPKYLGDKAARSRYARRMLTEDWHVSQVRVAAARTLHSAGYAEMAPQLLRDSADRTAFRRWRLTFDIPASLDIVPANRPTPGAPDGLPVPSSAPYRELLRHSGDVKALRWNFDGSRLATGGWDNTVRVIDPKSGRETLLQGHTNIVRDVEWHPRGSLLASGGDDSTIRIWDTRAGKELRAFSSPVERVAQVAWSPDGKLLAVAGRMRTVLLDAESGKTTMSIEGPGSTATTLWFSRDATLLYMNQWQSLSEPDKMLQIWNLKDITPRYIGPPDSTTPAVEWSDDGARVATSTLEKQIWVQDLKGDQVARLSAVDFVLAVTWHPGGRYLASAGDDRRITIWDLRSGKMLHILRGYHQPVSSLDWSPDGKWLASASAEGRVLFWDLRQVLPGATN